MTIGLRDVATVIGSRVTPPPAAVSGWSVDSRTLQAGDVFFALRGPNHDGHEYTEQAFEKGAVAAVIDREVKVSGTLLPVEDSCRALQTLAAWGRRRWPGTVIAVTGSAGKTTTKDTIAHLLRTRMRIGKTAGNFNNHVGLPLSILRLDEDCEAAVIEIGMNHAGEIRRLAGVARPDIGVVTNVGWAHVENFESVEAVALAKRELIEALPGEGTAVLNADDPRVARFREVHTGPVVTFGFSKGADIRAAAIERCSAGTRFHLDGTVWMATPVEGRHAVRNILAALAVAHAMGFRLEEFTEAVGTLQASPMRGRRFVHRGITVFDDCYNSNPDAVRAMVDTLCETPARRRIAVLGEMLELGRWTETLHQEIGRYVAACGVNVLVGIRGAARQMADAAVHAGLPASAAYFFSDPTEAGDHLKQLAREGDAILFKGSRGIRVEQALQRFLE